MFAMPLVRVASADPREVGADPAFIQAKMRTLRKLGSPYTDAQIAAALADLEGKTELDALISYLQGLGTAVKARR